MGGGSRHARNNPEICRPIHDVCVGGYWDCNPPPPQTISTATTHRLPHSANTCTACAIAPTYHLIIPLPISLNAVTTCGLYVRFHY